MSWKVLLVAVAALLGVACAPEAVETETYRATSVMLPEGEPQRGREAFVALGCAACHTVAWDAELPPPTSRTPGPELGVDVAKIGPGSLATSIVAPSHKVGEAYQGALGGTRSPMTDYTGVMTIRQLADIVAYLERQGLKTQSKTGQAPG